MLIHAHVEDEYAECASTSSSRARGRMRRSACLLPPLRLLSKEQQLVEMGEPHRRSKGVCIHMPGSARLGTLRKKTGP